MAEWLTLFKLGYFDDKDGWGGAKIAPPIGFFYGVSAMIKIFISNFQTKNLWEMRNF